MMRVFTEERNRSTEMRKIRPGRVAMRRDEEGCHQLRADSDSLRSELEAGCELKTAHCRSIL
jgi:hypothetical protein